MNLKYITLIPLIALLEGCDASNSVDEGPDCSRVRCDLPKIQLKLTYADQQGHDLLSAPGSPYSIKDLQVVSRKASQPIVVGIDSTTDNTHKLVIQLDGSDELLLTLGSLPADRLQVTATAKDTRSCCPSLLLKEVTLNNTSVCSSCPTTAPLVQIVK